jgi:hypothetical protein
VKAQVKKAQSLNFLESYPIWNSKQGSESMTIPAVPRVALSDTYSQHRYDCSYNGLPADQVELSLLFTLYNEIWDGKG